MAKRVAEAAPGRAAPVGQTVGDLVGAIRKEEITVHVDLGKGFKSISFEHFPDEMLSKMLPGNDVADKVAGKIAEMKKRTRVAKPFPYFEVSLFTPSDMIVSRCCAPTLCCMPCLVYAGPFSSRR